MKELVVRIRARRLLTDSFKAGMTLTPNGKMPKNTSILSNCQWTRKIWLWHLKPGFRGFKRGFACGRSGNNFLFNVNKSNPMHDSAGGNNRSLWEGCKWNN